MNISIYIHIYIYTYIYTHTDVWVFGYMRIQICKYVVGVYADI